MTRTPLGLRLRPVTRTPRARGAADADAPGDAAGAGPADADAPGDSAGAITGAGAERAASLVRISMKPSPVFVTAASKPWPSTTFWT